MNDKTKFKFDATPTEVETSPCNQEIPRLPLRQAQRPLGVTVCHNFSTSPSHIPTTSHVHSPTHASTQCSFRRITQRAPTFLNFALSQLHPSQPTTSRIIFCYFFTRTRPFRVVRNSYLFKTRSLPPILQLVIPVLGSTINLAGLYLNKMILISLLLLFKLINIRKYVQEKVCIPVWRQKSRW